jgi:predicted enzyme related to lactoylglutathione lyase
MTNPNQEQMSKPLLLKVDCVQVPVPSIADGIDFYCGKLGHELNWRSETQAGVRMPNTDAELVLQTERKERETDLLVESVDEAVVRITDAGGSVVTEPFDVPVGRFAVVADPFGNPLVLIDLSKGRYRTDADKNITGVQ